MRRSEKEEGVGCPSLACHQQTPRKVRIILQELRTRESRFRQMLCHAAEDRTAEPNRESDGATADRPRDQPVVMQHFVPGL